jgi:phosphohistidine phosphatase SixA
MKILLRVRPAGFSLLSPERVLVSYVAIGKHTMKQLMEIMLQVQELQLIRKKNPEKNPELAELRTQVPPQIIGHLDRLLARGKKAVSTVKNQGCGECKIKIPLGTIAVLMRDEDIQLCGNCGRYLYLPPEPPPEPPPPPKKRGRKKKEASPAVEAGAPA